MTDEGRYSQTSAGFLASASLSLLLVELLPNREAWPTNFGPAAQALGYAIPTGTFSPLWSSQANPHWVYPTLILTVGITGLFWGLLEVVRLRPASKRTLVVVPRSAPPVAFRAALHLVSAVGILLLIGWILITAKLHGLDWTQLPPPVVVVQALGLHHTYYGTSLLAVLADSCGRTLLSLLLALIPAWKLAESLGLRVGRSPRVAAVVAPYTYGLSALPPIVLFLVVSHFLSPKVLGGILVNLGWMTEASALVLLRDKEWLANILLTAWAVFWPIFAAACASAEAADRRMLAALAQIGADERTIRQKLIRPQARKNIYAGVETGIGIGMIVLLYAEGRSGVGSAAYGWNGFFYPNLGQLIDDSYDERRFADLLCIVIASTLLVLLLKGGVRTLLFLRAPWLRRQEGPKAISVPSAGEASGDNRPQFDRLGALYAYLNRTAAAWPNGVPLILLEGVEARFGRFILRINRLAIDRGAFVSVVGENGAGKTSLVELIGGLRMQEHVQGRMHIANRLVLDEGRWTEAATVNPVSIAHQDFALVQTMTVRDNLCFGLEMRLRGSKAEPVPRDLTAAAVEEMIEFLQLPRDPRFLQRYPDQLSRGQQQRIVLGRALLCGNPIIIVDEGLANIDQASRKKIGEGLRALGTKLGLTMLFVLHDDLAELGRSTTILHMASRLEDEHLVGTVVQESRPPNAADASALNSCPTK